MEGPKVATYLRNTHPRRPYIWIPYSSFLSLTQKREDMWPFCTSLEHNSMLIYQKKNHHIRIVGQFVDIMSEVEPEHRKNVLI